MPVACRRGPGIWKEFGASPIMAVEKLRVGFLRSVARFARLTREVQVPHVWGFWPPLKAWCFYFRMIVPRRCKYAVLELSGSKSRVWSQNPQRLDTWTRWFVWGCFSQPSVGSLGRAVGCHLRWVSWCNPHGTPDTCRPTTVDAGH